MESKLRSEIEGGNKNASQNIICSRRAQPQHDFKLLYPTWGLAGCDAGYVKEAGVFDVAVASAEELTQADSFFKRSIMLSDEVVLSHAAKVPFYIGPNSEPLHNVILLRYSHPEGGGSFGGEHISALIDLDRMCLLGYVNLIFNQQADEKISHNNALGAAVDFLKINTNDLHPEIPAGDVTFAYNTEASNSRASSIEPGAGVNIKDAPDMGPVSLKWMGIHYELVNVSGEEKKVSGMKVKMSCIERPDQYVWSIVDSLGGVVVFERDIFWNNEMGCRDTQMWLHDGWLKQHDISLPEVGVEVQCGVSASSASASGFFSEKVASEPAVPAGNDLEVTADRLDLR